jgi:hypothetical protein
MALEWAPMERCKSRFGRKLPACGNGNHLGDAEYWATSGSEITIKLKHCSLGSRAVAASAASCAHGPACLQTLA